MAMGPLTTQPLSRFVQQMRIAQQLAS